MRARPANVRAPRERAGAPAGRSCASGSRSWLSRREPAAEERCRPQDGSLVAVAESAEHGKRRLRVLVVAQRERVEPALLHEIQMIVEHVADRAQLSLEAVALAQKARDRIAAAVAELGEVHGDDREAPDLARDGFGSFVRVEPYPDPSRKLRQILATREPQRERDDHI